MASSAPVDATQALAALDRALAEKKITAEAAKNIRAWLTEPRYADYAAEVAEHIAEQKWKQLDDVFWTVIPFGTGGRRGKMYPIGSNAINDRTIGESAQGLADYIRGLYPDRQNLSCAIAYDTRHRSREFAELCSEIMIAAGFKVYFLNGFRSTPELSFTVRYKNCDCGIMVTASHNPPSDNAVKVYWAGGVQVLPPHDAGIIERVMNVGAIHRAPFQQSLAEGKVEYCEQECDKAFIDAVLKQAHPGPRELKVLYSPLHGVGVSAVIPVLAGDGFKDVEVFGPHATPDGDFPNVPGHVANPENVAVFDAIIARAKQISADVALATDPDCDRLGCAAPKTTAPGAAWETFTGNQIGVLLTDYVLDARRRAGRLNPHSFIVTTLVTTGMVRRVADSYNVRTLGNLLVGFKWIAQQIDDAGPENFVYGCEESHGYMCGTHDRDKDAAVASMLMAELAAKLKAEGQTLHGKLEALYWQFGYHLERQISITMPGSQGMRDMQTLMRRLRETPPAEIGGIKVACARDYLSLTQRRAGHSPEPLDGPKGDMVIFDLALEGNFVAARPSGTEPKIKFYLFAYEPAELIGDMQITQQEVSARADKMQASLAALAKV